MPVVKARKLPLRRSTLKVQRRGRFEKVEMSADGKGLASHAGSGLLVAVADKVGLSDALSEALGPTRERRSAHDPGEVVRDLCVMLADGGDCLSDLGALRDQEDLFGRVASNATAWRVIDSLSNERMLCRLREARAKARERAWALGAKPERIVLDLDATLICSHSDKEDAAGNYKGGFGFHPMLCYLDESQEAPAGILRPGNAGANTARDQIEAVDEALGQLPRAVVEQAELLVRADSAGLCHELLDYLYEGGIRFSVGMDMTEDVRQAVLAIGDGEWVQAVCADGDERERAFVAELSLELSGWPEGARAICRRARPPRGAALADRPRRLAPPGVHDQPAGRGHRPARPDPQRTRPRRGSHPLRQADGARESPLPRVRAERGLARAVLDRPGPDRLDQAPLASGWARTCRAKAPALPALAPGRADRPLGAADEATARALLALGASASRGVRAHQGAAGNRAALSPGTSLLDDEPGRAGKTGA